LGAGHVRAQDAAAEPPLEERVERAHAHPLTGRALVFLEADEGVDEFVRVFVFEVIAGRLRDHGLAVARGDTADAAQPPMTCLQDEACVRALQREHTAPLVLAFHIAQASETLTVTGRRSDAMAEPPLSIEDGEGGVAAALAQLLMELEIEAVPCVVLFESSIPVTFSVDGAEVQSPALVGPGDHRARAVAAEREAWSGALTCAGGRVLRVEAR